MKQFAQGDLQLKPTKNYTTFAKLNRPYVTYVVSAAPKWELKHHLWSYPFIGDMPYKGFFNEADARELEEELKGQDLDTFFRGVSAYSTLGWLKDPLLSSMLNYQEDDLVNTIIHETTHATLFIKSSADFNERMAVFAGTKGTELFYLKREGENSATLKEIRAQNSDSHLFSIFITKEIQDLKDWYGTIKNRDEAARQNRIKEIQERFSREIAPQMKTSAYKKFSEINLNNARLLNYKTYEQDLSDFEALYAKVGYDFPKFIEACKTLESSKHPEDDLKLLIK